MRTPTRLRRTERLAQDSAMRVIVGWQGTDKQAASTNTMSRFETEVLTEEENLEALGCLNVERVERAMTQTSHQRVILDMDSSESPVHGQQEGAAYNGQFECVCYHPLCLFNHFGDCEATMLRPGNVHSAELWREVLEPAVERNQEKGVRLLFRADADFARVSETMVTAKRADQAHQDGWTSGAVCQEVGVSAC